MPRTKLSRDLYSELRKLSTPTIKPKGTILFRAGQPVKGAFLVRSGQVKMTLDHSPLYPSRSLGAGTIIGLPATFSGEPYSLSAKVERDCRIDFIPRARLLELLRLNPKLGFQIIRMLSEEIFQMRKGISTEPRRPTSSTGRKR